MIKRIVYNVPKEFKERKIPCKVTWGKYNRGGVLN